ELIIPDVSEHQENVNWNAFVQGGNPVAIVRVHNGRRADNFWPANRDRFWAAGGRLLGLYAYTIPGRDMVDQANEFIALVGTLRAGEFAILDIEEGTGDLSSRASAWRERVAQALGKQPWLYTGQYFFREHNLAAAGFTTPRTWVAAYRSSRPTWPDHNLWQFSESFGPMPGIARPHDASRFYGSVDDLADVVGSAGDAQRRDPVPFPGADKFGPGRVNDFVTMLGTWLIAKGYGRFYKVGPSPQWGDADKRATEAFQKDQGWSGGNADGLPGQETWSRLQR
ncbi:peptidoglycan-binding protein, partial [Streptomyces sp. NPDC057757]